MAKLSQLYRTREITISAVILFLFICSGQTLAQTPPPGQEPGAQAERYKYDVEKEKKRLTSEVDRMVKILGGINAKLSNTDFVARAPEDVLVSTRAQKENLDQQVKNLQQNIESLS